MIAYHKAFFSDMLNDWGDISWRSASVFNLHLVGFQIQNTNFFKLKGMLIDEGRYFQDYYLIFLYECAA